MAATRADILVSLLEQLTRFDDQVAALLRSNRKQVATAAERLADSYVQIENSDQRIVRQLRDNRSFLPPTRRE